MEETKQVDEQMDDSFLEGTVSMDMEQTAVPLLLICQTNSSDAIEAGVGLGHFYNNLTKKDYGDEVKLVVAYHKVAWVEWQPNGGGFVGRYEPGSIEVTGNSYDGMTNPANGNKVVETWLYYVILPDHLEDGFLVMSSTPGNMKYLKAWNTQIKYLRTPNGHPAALYSSIWKLKIGKDQNKAGQKFYSLKAADGKPGIERVSWIDKELFLSHVQPVALAAPKAQLRLEAQSTKEVPVASEEY